MKKTALALALLAAALAAAPAQESGVTDPRRQEVLNKLNSMRVSVDFNAMPLEEAVNYLRDFSGLNIVVDAEIHQKLTEDQLKITLKVKDLLLKSVLKLMLGSRDLTAAFKDGVLLITTKGKVDQAVTLQMYDVRDLLLKIQDFPGPRVELVSPQGTQGGPLTGATFTLEEPKSTITEEFITEMVKSNTGDRTWDENPGASVSLANGVLIVSQSRRVHEEIRRLINKLRQFK